MRRIRKKAVQILVFITVLLTAIIPAVAATSNENIATTMYMSYLFNQNYSTSNPNFPSFAKDGSSIISAGVEYYLPFVENTGHASYWWSYITIYSPIDTNVRIDSNNDDIFETVLSIAANNETIHQLPSAGSHIISDDPVFIKYFYGSNDVGIYDDQFLTYTLYPVNTLGIDYYLPSSPIRISIVATQGDTNIQVDTNNDGTPEATYNNLESGTVRTYSSPPAGTHITSNHPIYVVAINYNWANADSTYGYTVIPTERLGTDYWFNIDYKRLTFTVVNDYTALHVVAAQDNTQLYFNSTNYYLNAGQSVSYSFNNGSVHITSDKPVGVAYVFDVFATDPWASVNRHYMHAISLIPTSQLGTEYPLSYYVVATYNNTQVDIDADFDNVFEDTAYLDEGEAINTFYYLASPPTVLTNLTGHIKSNYPVLSYYCLIKEWSNKPDWTYMYIMLPLQTEFSMELGAGQNQLVNASSQLGVELSLNLSAPILLNIAKTSQSAAGSAPSGLNFLGGLFSIVVNDTTAIEGVTITIHYTDWQVLAIGLNESSLGIWCWNETSGNWFNLSSIVDTENNTITTHTDHLTYNLTYFAVLGTPLPPAWLSGWVYRKNHTIIGSTSGAQTEYQMKITVHYGSGTDNGEHIYCSYKCRTDFQDIRFTKSDGITLLDYWLEGKTDGDKATFWVEVDSIPASPETVDIYAYYGKIDASTTGSGENTFKYFTDFLGTSLPSGWSQKDNEVGGYSVGDSVLKVWTDTSAHGTWQNQLVGHNVGYDYNNCLMAKIAHISQSDRKVVLLGLTSDIEANGVFYDTTHSIGVGGNWNYSYDQFGNWESGSSTRTFLATYLNDGDIVELARVSGKGLLYRNHNLEATHTTNVPTGDLYIDVWGSSGSLSGSRGEIHVDWVAIRNYVDPEPTHGSWGSEEQRVITIELGAGQNQQINLSAEFGVEFSLNLTNPVLLNITRPTGSVGGVAPPGLAFLGIFVSIEVNDTTAIEGITIIIHYTDQQIAELGLDESSLAMWYWNESSGNWVLLPSTVDRGNNIVFAHTDHLTYFAILGGLLPSGLPISPYLMFVLLFQLTQSELNPLIFLALGLVAVVIIAVTGLVLLIRREEEAAPTITAPVRQWSTTVEGIRCQFCGADIPENANFCIFCGGARARCSICNNELGSGDVVVSCPHCGAQGHRDHFLEWIKIRGTCPNCKEGLNRLDIV